MDNNIKSYLQISSALEIQSEDREDMNEEEMIIQIERRIAELMEKDFGLLMSYLYRLDILEPHINACLDPKSPVHPYSCLALLIWNRQLERLKTKQKFKPTSSIDKDWEW